MSDPDVPLAGDADGSDDSRKGVATFENERPRAWTGS
jgi:hypothetical protein